MRTLIIAVATTLALSGCATSGRDKPPICDGKHRRPANLYGSVLSPPPPASASDPIKPQARAVDPQAAYRSCMA